MLGKIVACRRFSWNVFRIHLKITKIIKEYLQIQMLYVFLNITPRLNLMKLLILVYKKPLKILIWLLETNDFVSINPKISIHLDLKVPAVCLLRCPFGCLRSSSHTAENNKSRINFSVKKMSFSQPKLMVQGNFRLKKLLL